MSVYLDCGCMKSCLIVCGVEIFLYFFCIVLEALALCTLKFVV